MKNIRKLVIELNFETFLKLTDQKDTERVRKRWLDAVALVNKKYVEVIRQEISDGLLDLEQ